MAGPIPRTLRRSSTPRKRDSSRAWTILRAKAGPTPGRAWSATVSARFTSTRIPSWAVGPAFPVTGLEAGGLPDADRPDASLPDAGLDRKSVV